MKNCIKRVSQFVIAGALAIVVSITAIVPAHAAVNPEVVIGVAQVLIGAIQVMQNSGSSSGQKESAQALFNRMFNTSTSLTDCVEVSGDTLSDLCAELVMSGIPCKIVSLSSGYLVIKGNGYIDMDVVSSAMWVSVANDYIYISNYYLHDTNGHMIVAYTGSSARILYNLSSLVANTNSYLSTISAKLDTLAAKLDTISSSITSLGTKLDTMNSTLTNILYNMTSYHMVDGNYREWQLDEIIWAIYGSSGAIENLSTSINNKLDSLTSPIVNVSVDGDTTVDVDLSSLNTNITLRAGEIVSAVNAAAYDDSTLMSKLSDIESALSSIACHHEYRTQRTIEGSSLTFEAVSEDDPISNVTATLPVRLDPYNGFTIQQFGDTQSTAYAVDWSNDYPDVVTGGRYDLDTGILTVTHIYWSLRWGSVTNNTEIGQTNARNFTVRGYSLGYGNAGRSSISTIPYAYEGNTDYPHFYCNYSGDASSTIRVFMPADTDGDTVLTFALQLATPLTYQLTPLELTPFVGNNTLTPSVGTLSMTILDGQYLTDMGYDLIVCQKCGQIEPIFDYSKLLDRLDDLGSTSLYTSADLSALVESVQSIQEWLENANLENNTTVNNMVNNYVDEVNVSIDSFGRILDLFVDAADFGHLTPDWFGASSYFANLGHDPIIDLGGE